MTNILANTAESNSWRMFAACLGLCGGLLCAVLGALLTAASWVTREPHNKTLLHQLDGTLLCLTMPLLLLGGFCLDGYGQPQSPLTGGMRQERTIEQPE
jgi:hypothetical protein